MLETPLSARRRPALPVPPLEGGTVAIRPLPAATRLSLRLRPGVAAALGALGALRIDLPVNRAAFHDERWAARLGPDEWLIGGPEDEADTLAAVIEAALAGQAFALVDVSHRSVTLEVAGRDAAALLNAGCPLDLHPAAFPPGAATRTLLGKAEITLMRPGEAAAFRVECWRSFATYVHGFLIEAARDVIPGLVAGENPEPTTCRDTRSWVPDRASRVRDDKM